MRQVHLYLRINSASTSQKHFLVCVQDHHSKHMPEGQNACGRLKTNALNMVNKPY